MRQWFLFLSLMLSSPCLFAAPLCAEVYLANRSTELIAELRRSGMWAQKLWEFKETKQEKEFQELEAYVANHLRRAEILGVLPISIGFSKPRLIELGFNMMAVIKSNSGGEGGGQTIQAELAAYRLDRYLGHLNRVPLTVIRNIGGEPHSVQLFVPSVPQPPKVRDILPELFAFDFLIDNPDRISSNILYIDDMKMVAIDNGLSFRTEFLERGLNEARPVSKKLAWSYILAECCMKSYTELEPLFVTTFFEQGFGDQVPLTYSRIKKLTPKKARELFSDILSDIEIKAFLKRRGTFLKAVEELGLIQ